MLHNYLMRHVQFCLLHFIGIRQHRHLRNVHIFFHHCLPILCFKIINIYILFGRESEKKRIQEQLNSGKIVYKAPVWQ